jgi:allantoin racemase
MLRANVARAGITERVAKIDCVDMSVTELKDTGALLKVLCEKSRAVCLEHGAEAIVLGCTAMIGVAEKLEAALQASGLYVPVIEPAQAALVMLEACARMGLSHSVLAYPAPQRAKEGL